MICGKIKVLKKRGEKMSIKIKDGELFIGIISTVGVDTSNVITYLTDSLNKFNYDVKIINISKGILSKFEDQQYKAKSEYDRITHYMDLGNQIRKATNDNSILMKGVSSAIFSMRDKEYDGSGQPKKRTAYIIKSIKHSDEVEYLRDTYGDAFYLIGVQSSEKNRIDYLHKVKNIAVDKAEQLLKRDADEDISHGQHTRDAYQHSDYFIEVKEGISLFNDIQRFIDLLFGEPYITPNFDEYAMFMAYASSLRSADLSRQVGAALARNNEIISLGANDCPKFGGGLYWPKFENGQYLDEDNGRDYKVGYDTNKYQQRLLIDTIIDTLNLDNREEAFNKIKQAGINDLTEYGRVVHAEMEALLCCARNNISSRNADLYVTTFPCHNCAKHIIAAGINRVVYIEPYPKSKALEMYKNEIEDGNESRGKKVMFEPFIGVGPQRYIDLFAMTSIKWAKRIRKNKDGKIVQWDRERAELRNPGSVLSYLQLEQNAMMNFEEEIQSIQSKNN